MCTKRAFLVLLLPGVNLAKVKKLCIGVGDRDHPQSNGTGVVYIDDIRVVPSASLP